MKTRPAAPVILLAGPTASGKTALAMALCDRFPLEIVSVDSAQVFRDMDIGTAKPDAALLARYPHALIDLISPEDAYSAGRFVRDADAAIARIHAAGRVPLLTGGTMLYFKAFREGLADLPTADPALRQALEADAAVRGWPALHADLARLDPAAAARIDPNHAQRIQRALELVRSSGLTLDALFATGQARRPPHPRLELALIPTDRSRLHQQIAQRFDAMLSAGLIDEVARLRRRYRLHPGLPSMRCVGYRQGWAYLDGDLTREQLLSSGIAATRQLAKRQLTWLRSMPSFSALDPMDPRTTPAVVDRVAALLRGAGH